MAHCCEARIGFGFLVGGDETAWIPDAPLDHDKWRAGRWL